MTRYKVLFTEEAWIQIDKQVRYIAIEKGAPINASRWLSRLLAEVGKLEQFPERNSIDAAQTMFHNTKIFRLVFERTYLVFYTVDQKRQQVNIVSFRHGARENPL